jgi:hypothetical protein
MNGRTIGVALEDKKGFVGKTRGQERRNRRNGGDQAKYDTAFKLGVLKICEIETNLFTLFF